MLRLQCSCDPLGSPFTLSESRIWLGPPGSQKNRGFLLGKARLKPRRYIEKQSQAVILRKQSDRRIWAFALQILRFAQDDRGSSGPQKRLRKPFRPLPNTLLRSLIKFWAAALNISPSGSCRPLTVSARSSSKAR